MTAQEALEKAIESGVFLYVQDDQLKYRARAGALSGGLRGALKEHREQIVQHLKRVQAADGGRFEPPPIARRPSGDRVPLSYAQQRLWFIDQLGEGSAQYHAQSAHRLTGRLNVEALRRALTTTVERHESLRTVIREENGRPYQEVRQSFELDWRQVDLSGLDEARQEAEIRRQVADDRRRAFDLGRDLMLRVRLLTLSPEAHVVLFDLHHIASDAWSQGILRRELAALYAACREGRPNPLPPLKLQYADYTVWQRSWLQGEVLARQLEYWQGELEGLPEVHDLPLDRARPARPGHVGGAERCRIDRETLGRIRALCKRYDVTLFMFLHTAVSVLLGRYSGDPDVVVGTPVAGRVHADLEPMIGLFVNTLVLRARLGGNPTFEALLASNRRRLLDALTHQHVPFEMVVEELSPRRSTSFNPVFQILFSLQPAEPRRFSLPGVAFEPVPGGSRTSKFDLVFNVVESADELSVNFGYSAEIFRAPTIARMAANFRVLLESILTAPGRRIRELDLLSPAERSRLLRELNEGREPPVFILDDEGRLLPEGARGELCVPAAELAGGPEAHPGKRLVPDPSADGAGRTLYRTGDLVRWASGGELEFLGRLADRVRVSGVWVDLAGFRAALAATRWITQYVLAARRDAGGGELLAAYVVCAAGQAPPRERQLDQLRNSLAAALRDPPVPFALVVVERIPLSPDGEAEIDALPLPESAIVPREASRRPATETEQRMERVWRTVLPDQPLGLADNFFAAGGHSLSMIVLIKRIAKEFGVDIPLATFIQSPTVEATSRLVGAARGEEAAAAGALPAAEMGPPPLEAAADAPPILPLSDAERGRPLPLSFAQARIWFITRLEEGQSSYNIPGALRLTGPLCRESLRRAFETIMARHAILRTVYRADGHQPAQVILAPSALSLPLVDLGGLPPEEQEHRIRERISAESIRPFDLTAEPSLRVLLLRLAEQSHLLVLNVHHIAADGWSIGVLIRELNAIYGAYRRGEEPSLPELPIQYCDYAVWQREWLASACREEHLGFWKERLNGLPKVHGLPLDRPRPAYQSYRGAHYPVKIGGEVARGLDELSRSRNGTLFMILQAALAVLLHRYSGESDVVIGTPVANRLQREVEPLIGCFVNTLVLRSDLAGNPRFLDFLTAANDDLLRAFAHQSVPFELLVEELNPERDLSHTPLFQVMLAFQSNEGEALALPDLTFTRAESRYPVSKFDLTLYARQTAAGLSLIWEYTTDLFARATVEALASGFGALLESIVGAPGERVDALRLMSRDAERQILLQGGGAVAEPGAGLCVHELFAARARERPGAVALRWGPERLTYGELNGKADRLARYLRSLGVRPGDLVGICVERSPELVVGLLAILKAGGAYVPLDAAYPPERLRYMLEDSGAGVVLTSRALRGRLPAGGRAPILLDDLLGGGSRALEGQPDEAPAGAELSLGPESLAYAIYTSGSTGQPKGAAIPHRGVTRLVWQTDYVELGPETVTLLHSSLSFDTSTFEIWAPLLNGGVLGLLQGDSGDVEALAREIEGYGVNTLWLTTGLLPLWMKRHTAALGIRCLLAGGDVVPPRCVDEIYARDPGVTIINGYGPTENTTFSCCHRVPRGRREGESLPIGTPVRGSSAYVLDRWMRPQPVGCPGELYVGGAGVARGYAGQPRLTGERFVPDPFAASPGERLYRTGDIARWLPDGTLGFLGRKDHQVKIRGFRVELGEIEAHLSRVPGVSDCVVLASDVRGTGRQLVAYVVCADDGSPRPPVDDLRERCRSRLRLGLPEHMVPGIYVLLDRMPLTPNGKIDRHGLPVPGEVALRAAEPAAPRTPTERRICELWQELLKLPQVGVDDGFFDLGGHSLLAFRFLSAAREVFGVEVPLRLVFEKPTVREIATWLDLYRDAGAGEADDGEGEEMFL
jgi:amino acid adenylation domain-containing protein